MSSVNKVTLIGNLGRDPEIRYAPSGDAVANFSVATSEKWKDKSTGEAKEKTEWHRVVFWGRLAEVIGEYVIKGTKLYIEGSLETRSYEKDGVTHYVTEIKGREMKILSGGKGRDGAGGGGGNSGGGQQRQQQQQRPAQNQSLADMDDDIPF